MSTELTRDDFEQWLFDMSDELDSFHMQYPYSNFSIKSIGDFENFVLEKFSTVNEAIDPKNKKLLDRMSRYLGEVIRREFDGRWDIELSDKDDAYYQLPVVRTPKGIRCPITMITTAIDRNNGFLGKILAKLKNDN